MAGFWKYQDADGLDSEVAGNHDRFVWPSLMDRRRYRTPFEHQLDAFEAMKKCFDFDKDQGENGLLVPPTGAGKSFTTVKWVCDNEVSRNIRILWLANSYYLLDQAFREIYHYARWIPEPRQTLNIRLVSSNPSHDLPSSILLTDEVVVMITPTAIKNLNSTAETKVTACLSDVANCLHQPIEFQLSL